ncbi:hypothetical protein SDJN02_18107, partial [Cucurbita argyrosperma subsp. argyrosperma]
MGIDAEDIKLCVCRIVHLSLRVSHRFVQKRPYMAGTLLCLFILYIFLPSVLSLMFYTLPFIGLIGILLAFRTSRKSTIRVEKVEDKKIEVSKLSTTTITRNRSAYLRNATSRRQRFKEKSEAWRPEATINASGGSTDLSAESDNSKSLIEVKETQSIDSVNNKSGHCTSVEEDIEVSNKEEPILGSELAVKPDVVACDGLSSQANKSDSGGDETKNESSEDPEDEDEEEARENRNKAVEWTEDDQKNLMDLGLSEIERNRRLESLIARRRARKLYRRKNEETALTVDIFPPGQIPKIIATRNGLLNLVDGCREMEGVSWPGSAPSILLPTRNPFDLPYDPHEEKPNLMADSFQQEFTAAHQKELAFCRHESFCFGLAYPEEIGGLGYHPRYRRPSISIADKGEHDWLIEQLLFKSDQVPRREKDPIDIETRSIQTEDSTQTRDANSMELESDQEKEIPPDSESELEMEPELMQDGNSQSSHSSSLDKPEDLICDDVRVVSKSTESTLSSAVNKNLNCRVLKSRLIKETLCEFSPMAFDKNKMEERFPYPDKVVCHTPTYSIASDMQVEVSEIGSPPTVDGNNTDGESLNPDWEIEKEASFGGEQDDLGQLMEVRFNEIVSGVQEEKVKALSVKEASSPKTIKSPMAEELVDHPSQVVPQMPEELSFPTDDDEEAISCVVDQINPEALVNLENVAKTSEEVDDVLEILVKQEEDGNRTGSLEETDRNSSNSFNVGSEDSSGCQAHLHHEHSEEGNKNMDQITGNGDLGCAHKLLEEEIKSKDQITGSGDLGRAHEHSEEGSKNTDQITGIGDLVEPRKVEEQFEFIHDNKNQPNVMEAELQCSKNSLKLPVEDDSVTYGGVPLAFNDINTSENPQSEFQKSIEDLVEPRKVEEQLEFIQDNKNQPNAVEAELQSSKNSLKLPVEDDSVTYGGVPFAFNDIMCSSASENQVSDVQSEFQKSNEAFVEPRKIEVPLELKQDNKNQLNAVEIEFQSSKDTLKSTMEDDLVNDGGVTLEIVSDASQNQVNAVQSEFQKPNDVMKSTVEQDSVTERELLDTTAGLSPESSMEKQVHMDKVSLSQDPIVFHENNPKTMEKDDNKPAGSIEVENEFIKDVSEQKGEKSNLDANHELEKTNQNLSSPNSELNVDVKIAEEVAAAANPVAEITAKEVEVETVPTPITNKNMEAVGGNIL